MPLNRRHFLKFASLSLTGLIGNSLTACTHKNFFNPDEDILLSGGSFTDDDKTQNCLVIINLTLQEKRIIETPFLPHGINIDPNNKYRIFCFEKNGKNACELDVKTERLVRTFQAHNNQLFSGHACFSENGKALYCIEKNEGNEQGVITVRNAQTFEATHQLPTLGLNPHHCQLTKDNHLVISNTKKSDSGFHQPSLVVIDLNTGKLVERIKLDNKNLNAGHFKTLDTNDLIIASAPIAVDSNSNLGGISFRKNKTPPITMSEPDVVIKRMIGEALSIETNHQQTVAVITHPEANLLTFWSIKNEKIMKAYGFEKPRGLCKTLDKKYFVISYGEKPAMAKILIKDLTPQVDSVVKPTLATGEHILNWSVTIREIMPKRVYG